MLVKVAVELDSFCLDFFRIAQLVAYLDAVYIAPSPAQLNIRTRVPGTWELFLKMRCCVWLVLTLQVAQAALPSFLVFLVDDLGFADLGCFGSSNHSTPHIDAMRAGGLKLTQWISAAPICTPSRAALQTGRLPRRYGMTANQLPWRVMTAPSQATGLPSTELTVASLLKQRGYSTGMSGKVSWRFPFPTTHLGAVCVRVCPSSPYRKH